MRRVLIAITASMATNMAYAMTSSCWVVDRMEGVGFYAENNYKQTKDRISSPIMIQFNGDKSNVSYHDEPLIQIGDYTLIGAWADEASFMYFVDASKGKAIMTRIRNEKVQYSTGAVTLVGDAKPCQ